MFARQSLHGRLETCFSSRRLIAKTPGLCANRIRGNPVPFLSITRVHRQGDQYGMGPSPFDVVHDYVQGCVVPEISTADMM